MSGSWTAGRRVIIISFLLTLMAWVFCAFSLTRASGELRDGYRTGQALDFTGPTGTTLLLAPADSKAAAILAIPVLIAAAPLLILSRLAAVIAASLLVVFCLLSILSVDMYYFPGTLLMVLAAGACATHQHPASA
jgi:hypothetical protein